MYMINYNEGINNDMDLLPNLFIKSAWAYALCGLTTHTQEYTFRFCVVQFIFSLAAYAIALTFRVAQIKRLVSSLCIRVRMLDA